MAGQQRDVTETSPAQHAACGYRTRPVTAVDDEGILDLGGDGALTIVQKGMLTAPGTCPERNSRCERTSTITGAACASINSISRSGAIGESLDIAWASRATSAAMPGRFRRRSENVPRNTSKISPAVHRHVENAAVAARQLRLDAKFVLDCGRQTGSPGQVVSTSAVKNCHAHM